MLYNRFLGRELGLCTEETILEGLIFEADAMLGEFQRKCAEGRCAQDS